MTKKYKGSLSLEWFNKQKALVNLDENSIKSEKDIPAPRINWINKEEALFYEFDKEEGKGKTPYWVNRDDIRVKEARPLVFQKAFKAKEDGDGLIVKEMEEEDALDIENILIKGDNFLALNTLKKHFDKLPDNKKVKCIYIDPPFNTEQAFEHYEDNLEHSEWLTLMRDRLSICRQLLSSEGVICIHLDDKEVFYCKVLMDEIFGRDMFVNSISVKSSTPSGRKTAHRESKIIKTKDYILVYKNSDKIVINPQYSNKGIWDSHFSRILDLETLKVRSLVDTLKEEGIITAKEKIGDLDINNDKFKQFYLKHKNAIFQTQPSISESAKKMSLSKPDQVVTYNSETSIEYALNGRRLVFLDDSINLLDDGTEDLSTLLCDFWDDIDFQNTQNEGGVSFPSSKKPEKLVKRIISLFSKEGDLVFDLFGGSGTTYAVAQKLKRNWIGIEIGNHADSHIIPRLRNVLNGNDQSGISKSVGWKGGGSFKYYHLGESIISIDEDTKKGEFNWSLGKEFIQESLLQSYDFIVQVDIELDAKSLFENEGPSPTLGKFIGTSNKAVYGIAFLAAPHEKDVTITNEEVKTFYNYLKNQSDFQSLVIYTNKGVDIAQDAVPDDLDVIKVPHAIFSELER